jgi:hypothetical protein
MINKISNFTLIVKLCKYQNENGNFQLLIKINTKIYL